MTLVQELKTLRASYEAKGLFNVPKFQFFLEVVLCVTLYGVGLVIYPEFPLLGLFIHWVVGVTIVWSIHDLGHGAFIGSKTQSRWACEILGLWYLGMPQIEYHFQTHRRHHSFTNILGYDLALNTGFVAWDSSQLNNKVKSLQNKQSYLWNFFVLPLTYPILTIQCTILLFQTRQWFRILLLLFRWTLFLYLFQNCLLLLFIPPLIVGYILGLSASLNHFHMPIFKEKKHQYPASVFYTTQNIDSKSRFIQWLTGGLNLHIEHHLFPDMPSRNLHLISEDIRALALENGLFYQSHSFSKCMSHLWKKLREIESLLKEEAVHE